MRKIGVVLFAVLCAACTTSSTKFLYKPGVTISGKQLALDQCRIASLKEIPQTMATDVQPGYSSPGTVQCNTIGTSTFCNNVGAVNIPGSAVSYDVNASLRDRYIDRCLEQAGYQVVVLPSCASEPDRSQAEKAQAQGQIPKCFYGPHLK